MKILVINGPNLARLDIRDSSIYGDFNYDELKSLIEDAAATFIDVMPRVSRRWLRSHRQLPALNVDLRNRPRIAHRPRAKLHRLP